MLIFLSCSGLSTSKAQYRGRIEERYYRLPQQRFFQDQRSWYTPTFRTPLVQALPPQYMFVQPQMYQYQYLPWQVPIPQYLYARPEYVFFGPDNLYYNRYYQMATGQIILQYINQITQELLRSTYWPYQYYPQEYYLGNW